MQCASHLNLGWRINVTDPISTTTTSTTIPPITTTIAPPITTIMITTDISENTVSERSVVPPSSVGQLYSSLNFVKNWEHSQTHEMGGAYYYTMGQ